MKLRYDLIIHNRIIKVRDANGKELTFVTNILNFSSEEIVWFYKKRWDIGLFFKWIKQHLKIKAFIGHSYNTVMIQLITGIITYILLKLIAKEAGTLACGLLKIKRKVKYCLSEVVNLNTFNWTNWLSE